MVQFSLLSSGNKVLFTSLGCPRNLVDTEVMLGLLLRAGYEMAESVETADFLVVNTCGFLAAARAEACEVLEGLFAKKKASAKVIATGCMVQRHKDELRETFPRLHYMLGSGNVEDILVALQSEEAGEKVTSARSYLEMGEVPRVRSTPKHYAYLKIAEGCRKRCSYCVIPTIKGPLKSKSPEQILKEFRTLTKDGVREVILIAQDLGDYGKDWKQEDAISDLLEMLLSEKGNFWIRLMYLYPDEITDRLITLFQKDDRLLPYLDMPIQHINDEILKRMRRQTSGQEIRETISKLRTTVPNVVIRTSLIVGFPGETEEAFEELCTFIEEFPLDNIGIFQFSQEPGAPAATMENQISETVKQERYARLMEIQQEQLSSLQEKWIGQRFNAFVEGYHPETKLLMTGRCYAQAPEIDGHLIINDHSVVDSFGTMYTVEIMDIAGYDLVARVIEKVEETTPSPLQLLS